MIEIKKISPQTVEAFDPDDKSLGFLNLYEFQDLRIQVKQKKLEGYYLMFKSPSLEFAEIDPWIKIKFLPTGMMSRNPKGFFDFHMNQLYKIII